MAKVTNEKIVKVVSDQAPWAWTLFVAYIGAVVYFFSMDQSFWGFIFALIKAIFWPAYIVYEVLGVLGVK